MVVDKEKDVEMAGLEVERGRPIIPISRLVFPRILPS